MWKGSVEGIHTYEEVYDFGKFHVEDNYLTLITVIQKTSTLPVWCCKG